MIDDVSKENRKKFEEKFNVRKLDFLPGKYFDRFVDRQGSNYDHPLLYRNKKYDYLVVSLYETLDSHERMMREGFEETPSMYNKDCQSYFKRFLNTRSQKVKTEDGEF